MTRTDWLSICFGEIIIHMCTSVIYKYDNIKKNQIKVLNLDDTYYYKYVCRLYV